MPFSLTIDTAEPRIKRDRIVVLADGRHWDDLKNTAFVESITQTGMLAPLPRTPEWETTTTGNYARLGKSDYTFDIPPFVPEGTPPPYPDGAAADANKWIEHLNAPGDIFLVGQGVNDRAITNAKFPKNRSFYLAWFAYNEGKTSQVQIEFGWISESAYIGCAVWTDGKVQIFKNGVQVGQGNAFERNVTSQTVYGKERITQNTHKKARQGDAKQLAQQLVDMLIIPCRRRDLLFQTNQGGGFRFTFEDLDPDNPDNTITPANARFFWRVPVGQAFVQCAPLHFKTTGNLISQVLTFSAPPGGDVAPMETAQVSVYTDQPGYGTGTYVGTLVEPDGATAFTPDGEKYKVRVKVALTGDGTASNWIYGASGVYDAITKPTNSDFAFDIAPYVQQASLSVPENPADVLFKVTCNAPEQMEADGASFISTVANRPVEAAFGDVSFLTGRTKTPQRKIGISDETSHLMIEMRDRCKALEEYRFANATPYDGLELAEAMKQIITLPGYSRDDIDIEDFGFTLPTIGASSEGEFALYPEVGDKAIDWFTRLWQTYAPHTEWMWLPTATGPVFVCQSLDYLNGQESVLTLYPTVESARTIGGYSEADAPFFVYRTSEPSRIECEANVIHVTGRDPRTALIFRTVLTDTRSADPELLPDARPDNWLGEPRIFGWADPSIIDIDTAEWVGSVLMRRLGQPRDIQPFDTEMLFKDDGSPVWRGDIVTLWGIGDTRITSLSAQFQAVSSLYQWKPTHYTSELVRYPTL